MSDVSIKMRLAQVIAQVHAEEDKLIKGLSDAEREREGTYEDWSARDMLAHIHAWNIHLNDLLRHAIDGATPEELSDDLEAVNRGIFDRYHGASWEQTLAMIAESWGGLEKALEELSEEMLTDTQRFAWENGRPLERHIQGNLMVHNMLHYCYFHMDHGDFSEAERLEKIMYDEAAARPGAREQGVARYNLACFYARAGRKAQAMTLLNEALQYAPDLKSWSREDTDLANLHGDEEFEKLTAEAAE